MQLDHRHGIRMVRREERRTVKGGILRKVGRAVGGLDWGVGWERIRDLVLKEGKRVVRERGLVGGEKAGWRR